MDSRLTFSGLLALLVLLAGCQTVKTTKNQSAAQESYVTLHYKNIPETDIEAYLEVEKFWKPIHEKRIAEGRMRSWFLYKVKTSDDQPLPYNYVTANVYPSLAVGKGDKVTSQDFIDVYGKSYMETQGKAMFQQTGRVNHIVREDIIKPVSVGLYTPGKMRRVNFIKVKEGAKSDFLHTRANFIEPIFSQMVHDPESNRSGWFLSAFVESDTENAGYDFMTHDIFTDRASLESPGTGKDYTAMAFPTMSKQDRQAEWQRMGQMKTSTRRELWEVLECSLTNQNRNGIWTFQDNIFQPHAVDQTTNLKVYSGDHFVVIHMKNGEVTHTHAGSVHVEAGKTTETIYANSERKDAIIGKAFTFSMDFRLTHFIQSGRLPDNNGEWVETWQRATKQSPNTMGLEGTWIRDTDNPNRKMIKFIQDKTWVWIVVDMANGRITNALGGQYQCNGRRYSEIPTFHFNTPRQVGSKFEAELVKADETLELEITRNNGGKVSKRIESWRPMSWDER